MIDDMVVIRGGGDIATGIAHRLYRSGFKILILETDKPMVIRRTVSFAQAVFDGHCIVEGVKAIKVNNIKNAYDIWNEDHIPVMIDPDCAMTNELDAAVLVDAILAKKNLGTHKGMADITIGVGPGFFAGEDVDIVIETCRGHDLGRLIFTGSAQPNTGIPGEILGYGKERVLRAPCEGIIKTLYEIGDTVKKGQILAYVNEEPVRAALDGVLRGMITNDFAVTKGFKIGDVDPRGIKEYCFTISDKARAVGGGVLEGILYMKRRNTIDFNTGLCASRNAGRNI